MCTIIAAIVAFGNDLHDLYDKIFQPISSPKLIQVALSDSAHGYETNTTDLIFGERSNNFIQTFEQVYPLYSPPRLVLLFTIQNTSTEELLVTNITYIVTDKGQVKSIFPKPLEPNKTYTHNLHWTIGTQVRRLTPVYSVPAKQTGAFEVEITTGESTPLGSGVILTIQINTNLGTLETNNIQLYLPVSKSIEKRISSKSEKNSLDFHKIPIKELTDWKIVESLISTSGLDPYCKKENFRVLERDFLFRYTSIKPFHEYKKIILPGKEKSFGEIFPNEKLQYFWTSTRDYLIKTQQNSSNKSLQRKK